MSKAHSLSLRGDSRQQSALDNAVLPAQLLTQGPQRWKANAMSLHLRRPEHRSLYLSRTVILSCQLLVLGVTVLY